MSGFYFIDRKSWSREDRGTMEVSCGKILHQFISSLSIPLLLILCRTVNHVPLEWHVNHECLRVKQLCFLSCPCNLNPYLHRYIATPYLHRYTIFASLHHIWIATPYLYRYTIFASLHHICIATPYLHRYTIFASLHRICIPTPYLHRYTIFALLHIFISLHHISTDEKNICFI